MPADQAFRYAWGMPSSRSDQAEAIHPALIRNILPEHGAPLALEDADALGIAAADEVERFLANREDHAPTPLVSLPGLAHALGIGAIHVKDEGKRLGLGSFKALGGAYAVVRLVLEAASGRLGRLDVASWRNPEVTAVAAGMTMACATDGLGPGARAFLINTEGATDPALYEKLVGVPPGA